MTPFEKGEALLCCAACCAPFEINLDWELRMPDVCNDCFGARWRPHMRKTQMFPIPFKEW